MSDSSRLASALADRYALDRELGAGGMATVYLAHDVRHDRKVAVKVLRPELAAAVGAERFLREIAIAAHLQHPHILTLIDSGTADGFVYYVMPYVEGESLRDRLVRDGALPIADATRILYEVVDALAHAHRQGVVHRDIKPENVMLAERHALVVDFGVAKAMSDVSAGHQLTSAGVSLGTPVYMAPEQVAADPNVDLRADIYAVGIVAYEMLSGAPPFIGSLQAVLTAHVTATPVLIRTARPDVSPALEKIVMKCLEKDPGARFQSSDELLRALEEFTTPAAGTRAGAIGTAASSRLLRVSIAAGVVLIAVGATYVLTARSRRERWVRATAIPEIQRLATAYEFDSAFALASRAAAVLPRDPILESSWPRISAKVAFQTEPTGATIYRAPFADTSRWELVGTTPTDSVRLPVATYTRLRIEKAGYRPMRVLYSPGSQKQPFLLDPDGSPDSDMVHVSRGRFSAALPGLDQVEDLALGDFLIGRHETTNREYKAFVAAGGYAKQEYWDHTFEKDGRRIPWDSAMALFRDKTGRPGPSTWEAGDIPNGQDDFPVGGVSWYEAAAYARFTKRSLPTAYHWSRAAETAASAWVVPGSNLESQGPA
jgi:tRNA A-37 threonylcarbamoyl transferase component Bud32